MLSKSNHFHEKTKFCSVKIGFYAETKQKPSKNQDKPSKVAKTVVKYNFNHLNQVSGDYWGGPPPPPEIAGGINEI